MSYGEAEKVRGGGRKKEPFTIKEPAREGDKRRIHGGEKLKKE